LKLKRRLPVGADLGVQWDKWADGRAWRLKRKRDYADVASEILREAASNAADRMGKAVRTVEDRYFPEKYVWVQFADHRIKIGDPCRCGSRRILRLHTHFGRCPECNARLILAKGADEEERKEARPVRLLRELEDVHLARREQTDEVEIYRGYARQEETGTPVLLLAGFRADPEELTAEQVYDRIDSIQVVPFQQLTDLFDPASLWSGDESDWDLVF
jgi:hypothetical protein